MSKNELRQSVLQARRALSPSLVTEMSRSIGKRLTSQPEFKDARLVAAYAAKPDEVQTTFVIEDALANGKRLALPRVDAASGNLLFFEVRSLSDLVPGKFGVLEPANQEPPMALGLSELVLVPVVAWDETGHRVGYGRGYFDRALSSRGSSVAAGLAFESQLVPKIPAGPSDVRLDMVVTERRVLRFRRGTE